MPRDLEIWVFRVVLAAGLSLAGFVLVRMIDRSEEMAAAVHSLDVMTDRIERTQNQVVDHETRIRKLEHP